MRELLRDGVAQMTAFLIVLVWGFSACARATGVMFDRRAGFYHLSAEQLRDVWHLPILLTILWTPIILFRAWRVR